MKAESRKQKAEMRWVEFVALRQITPRGGARLCRANHFERSEASGASIFLRLSLRTEDACSARASFVGNYGSTESCPTLLTRA